MVAGEVILASRIPSCGGLPAWWGIPSLTFGEFEFWREV